jgi:hypothetical protein
MRRTYYLCVHGEFVPFDTAVGDDFYIVEASYSVAGGYHEIVINGCNQTNQCLYPCIPKTSS